MPGAYQRFLDKVNIKVNADHSHTAKFLRALVFQVELADGPGRPTPGLPIGSIMHRNLDESTGDSCFG
ncbi:hypothetical protein D3C75_959320 [compost metagenome]